MLKKKTPPSPSPSELAIDQMIEAFFSEARTPERMNWTPDQHTRLEKYWIGLRDLFEERGYVFRPRYRKGWVASWLKDGEGAFPLLYEDGFPLQYSASLDGMRTSDNSQIVFKRCSRSYSPHEVPIAQYLTCPALASDPRNHSVPIYDAFAVPEELKLQAPNENGEDMLVMPMLRQYDSPRFDTVGEAVDFFGQIFEGMQFMHAHNIAHRDANRNNIMMDAHPLYPEPWHPLDIDVTLDFKRKAEHYYRTAHPVKYCYIDFGLSRRYEEGKGPGKAMERIVMGGDKSPPEYHIPGVDRCDPFPTDVYHLGSLIRKDFIEAKYGFDFMNPLVDDMTATDPASRPTMDEVITRFEAILASLSTWKLRSRVVHKDDLRIAAPFRMIPHWMRRMKYIVKRTPAIPSQRTVTVAA